MANDKESSPPGHAKFLLIQGKTPLIIPLPSVSIKKVKNKVSPMVGQTPSPSAPDSESDKITENTIQPKMSTIIAAAIIKRPVWVLNIPKSIKIRATTAKAVMEIAKPKKVDATALSLIFTPKNSGNA